MSNKWSASRVGTYTGCKLRYKYQYLDKWQSSDTSGVDVQQKGLCFHETAEQYHTGMTDEEAEKMKTVGDVITYINAKASANH